MDYFYIFKVMWLIFERAQWINNSPFAAHPILLKYKNTPTSMQTLCGSQH